MIKFYVVMIVLQGVSMGFDVFSVFKSSVCVCVCLDLESGDVPFTILFLMVACCIVCYGYRRSAKLRSKHGGEGGGEGNIPCMSERGEWRQ